ncbi:carboxypeptidase-like regulatory domain-containing protein [Sabulilitoribacter arenilitoris]|uniref:Carboxypeptidase-like regulatory domain-containing protein n=1 Tax=Wocania arenilitoris TaxID=2044858 RepID=A0AAE3EKY2_9FLAO|nr:carboxypeptidase-like regulatory domain-containing protein [Wocania arenilitoris]MCF7567245.1 carboxypeptidase-like regulatory domain-containing protein [Wocania arenilitoris]
MERKLTFLLIVLLSHSIHSQSIRRIGVKGLISANNNDIENVTVYNTSSNKGTITNTKGEFIIKVGLNDIIEVSALQFKAVTVKVTKEVIESKLLKIYLAEHINQLDAVLLSSGLSGNLNVDIDEAEELPVIQLDLGNMNALEYFDDKAFDNKVLNQELDNVMNNNTFYNGIDFAKTFGLNKLLKRKSKRSDWYSDKDDKPKDILDGYSHEFISETFNISIENVEWFIAFLEENGIKEDLYKTENEMYLIEFLVKQSKVFLKLKDEKL